MAKTEESKVSLLLILIQIFNFFSFVYRVLLILFIDTKLQIESKVICLQLYSKVDVKPFKIFWLTALTKLRLEIFLSVLENEPTII